MKIDWNGKQFVFQCKQQQQPWKNQFTKWPQFFFFFLFYFNFTAATTIACAIKVVGLEWIKYQSFFFVILFKWTRDVQVVEKRSNTKWHDHRSTIVIKRQHFFVRFWKECKNNLPSHNWQREWVASIVDAKWNWCYECRRCGRQKNRSWRWTSSSSRRTNLTMWWHWQCCVRRWNMTV